MSEKKYVYCAIPNQAEWEDLIIFDNESQAAEYSVKNPHSRVEVFIQPDGAKGYVPTYNYYKNGVLHMT